MVIYHLHYRTVQPISPIQVVERHLPAVGRSDRGLHWWRSAPVASVGCWMMFVSPTFFPLMLDVGCSFIDVGCHQIISNWYLAFGFGQIILYAVEWNWMDMCFSLLFHHSFVLRIRPFGISNKTPMDREDRSLSPRSLVLAPAAPAGTERCSKP